MSDPVWGFADACEQARSQRAVRDLLGSALHVLGFERYLLTTHGAPDDLRSLGVLAHNWPSEALQHLCDGAAGEVRNPLFEAIEQRGDLNWQAGEWRTGLSDDQLAWLEQLCTLVHGYGVSRVIRCAFVNASCSLVSSGPVKSDRVSLAMRMATLAYHHIQYLQRPALSPSERLTAREHECLYRAVVCGERPRTVARKLGVKVSTIRTLRQKASARLDADSPEQAVWRMLETGQLFRRGRKSKPRTR